MILRGTDLLLDFISEIIYDDKKEDLKLVVDYTLLSFYFLENAPSIIILGILFQKVRGRHGFIGSHDSDYAKSDVSNSLYQKTISGTTR